MVQKWFIFVDKSLEIHNSRLAIHVNLVSGRDQQEQMCEEEQCHGELGSRRKKRGQIQLN